MVDAPRLVNSDASPTRPEWAVTRSTPAAQGRRLEPQPHHLRRERHDAVRLRRVRGGPQGPDRAGDAALHEPDVRRLAVLVRLAPADGDQHPVAVGRVGDVGPVEGAHLAPPHSGHEEEPCDHGGEAAALEGDPLGLGAAASPARPVAGGEDGGEVRGPERPRLPSAAIAGGPPVAGEDPGRPFPGRARLAGEAGPEARRGYRRRRARRRPALVVELGEVGGEGRVLEPPAVEPGGQAAEGPGVRPAGVRAEGGLGEASGARARPRRGGSGRGNPSPLQPFDPRVAGLGDPDLEAVDAGLERPVRRDPDDEGVDEAVAAGPARGPGLPGPQSTAALVVAESRGRRDRRRSLQIGRALGRPADVGAGSRNRGREGVRRGGAIEPPFRFGRLRDPRSILPADRSRPGQRAAGQVRPVVPGRRMKN